MSGIKNLIEIYNKKGKEFTEKLFKKPVTINEKVDGAAFSFERSHVDGEFLFYKRDHQNR